MFLENLEFEPIIKFNKFGNEIQRSKTTYKDIDILWEIYIPWNIFKDHIDTFMVDQIVSDSETIKNCDYINCDYYTETGFGYPIFKTLEHAIEYINSL